MIKILQNTRQWLICWLYAVAVIHMLVGLLLPWLADAVFFRAYHHGIEAFFWGGAAPPPAHAQQLWWIALFGPTIQNVALWLAALIHFGSKYKSAFAWWALIIGIAVWAPQDMWISLRADCWTHVWMDCVAIVSLIPPLLWLAWHDRSNTNAK